MDAYVPPDGRKLIKGNATQTRIQMLSMKQLKSWVIRDATITPKATVLNIVNVDHLQTRNIKQMDLIRYYSDSCDIMSKFHDLLVGEQIAHWCSPRFAQFAEDEERRHYSKISAALDKALGDNSCFAMVNEHVSWQYLRYIFNNNIPSVVIFRHDRTEVVLPVGHDPSDWNLPFHAGQ